MKKVFLMIALMIPLATQAENQDVSGFCQACMEETVTK